MTLTLRECLPIVEKIFWLITITACSPTISATQASFDCRNASEYKLIVVQNPNRKKDSDSGVPEDVNVLVGDEVISRIALPTESEVKNFSLNSIEKTKAGFKLTTDWGGDREHYEIQFNFRCQGKNFYLYRVKKISFSTTKPDSGNFWDKQKFKVTKIVPNLPIKKFVMTDWLCLKTWKSLRNRSVPRGSVG